MSENSQAVVAPVEASVRPSTLAAFSEALNGRRGELDAWLECNNEAEVRAHVLALLTAERERCAAKAAPEHIPFSDDEWRVRCEVRDSILEA